VSRGASLLSLACVGLVGVASCTNFHPPTPPGQCGGAPSPLEPTTSEQPELVVQSGYIGSTSAIAISPNDEWIVLGGASGIAQLFELRTGKLLRRFIHHGNILTAAFSPGGQFLATGTLNGEVQLWGVRSGERLLEYARAVHGDVVVEQGDSGVQNVSFAHQSGPVHDLAFSADGRELIALVGDTTTVWQIATAKPLLKVGGDKIDIRAAALSPDGNWAAVALWSGEVRLYSVCGGAPARTVTVHDGGALTVAFSADNEWLVSGGRDHVAVLSQVQTATPMRRFEGHSDDVTSVALSPDKRFLITGSDDQSARVWKIADGSSSEPTRFGTIRHVAFSPSGNQVLLAGDTDSLLVDPVRGTDRVISAETFPDGGSGMLLGFAFTHDSDELVFGYSDGHVRVLQLDTQRYFDPFARRTLEVGAVAFSPDDRLLFTGNADSTITPWDLYTGKPRERIQLRQAADEDHTYLFGPGSIGVIQFNGSGDSVLANIDRSARLLDAATGAERKRFPSNGSIALSPDGNWAVTGQNGVEKIWDVRKGAAVHDLGHYRDGLQAAAFSRDSQSVLIGEYFDNVARLWDVTSGKPIRELAGDELGLNAVDLWGDSKGLAALGGRYGAIQIFSLGDAAAPPKIVRHAPTVSQVLFSPDGRYLLSAGADSTTRFWDVATAQEVKRVENPSRLTTGIAMTHDSHWLAVGDVDGNTVIWDANAGREAVRVLSLSNGGWVVVTPDGRFDADSLEHVQALDWVMPDDPMRLLPVETFMRDYYEPRLLSRVLSGESLPKVRKLTALNRAQPKVTIQKVTLEPSGDTISVDVGVENQTVNVSGKNGSTTQQSGMTNLRLFRDQRLVGYVDNELNGSGGGAAALVHFKNIKLTKAVGQRAVELSAYAFNNDGVKSATTTKSFDLPTELRARGGKAYIIAFGVGSFSNHAWDLDFAANDATALADNLEIGLKASQQFDDVVPIKLIADKTVHGRATKDVLKAVFEILAGKPANAEARGKIPDVDRLHEVRPEDLVVVSASTHGYADRNGSFHLFPEDIGQGTDRVLNAALLASTITGDDLRDWWRPVDAGEMVLIIDACQSAAAVEGGGTFKPGPLGNRGLGQLAYDKGIRILVASQADDSAVESGSLKHGLLTYALTADGLQAARADHAPKDGVITLDEWLAYAVQRVPSLYGDVVSGKIGKKGVSLVYTDRDQTPALFDFTKRASAVKLLPLKPP